jgi:hypothetical protein
VGNVPDHKTPSIGVANLKENANAADGTVIFGEYNGVRVGVIKTNGQVGTIFPDATKQP